MNRRPRRGDVYRVGLDPVIGTEIRKTRPAVIVSNDSCNRHGTRVVVLPITSNVSSLFPGEALITSRGSRGVRSAIRFDRSREPLEGSGGHPDASRDDTGR